MRTVATCSFHLTVHTDHVGTTFLGAVAESTSLLDVVFHGLVVNIADRVGVHDSATDLHRIGVFGHFDDVAFAQNHIGLRTWILDSLF